MPDNRKRFKVSYVVNMTAEVPEKDSIDLWDWDPASAVKSVRTILRNLGIKHARKLTPRELTEGERFDPAYRPVSDEKQLALQLKVLHDLVEQITKESDSAYQAFRGADGPHKLGLAKNFLRQYGLIGK